MIFLLCSPWLEPWYLAWFIPFVGFVTRRTVIAVAVALSLIASESLVTELTSGLVLHTLARLSYDVYPILALGFLIVLLVEVVRPCRPTCDGASTTRRWEGTRLHGGVIGLNLNFAVARSVPR